MISFVETKLFTRLVQDYLSDDEYSQLQQVLAPRIPKSAQSFPALAAYARCDGEWLVAVSVEDFVSSIFCARAKVRSGC
jgi:hypothetical protein